MIIKSIRCITTGIWTPRRLRRGGSGICSARTFSERQNVLFPGYVEGRDVFTPGRVVSDAVGSKSRDCLRSNGWTSAANIGDAVGQHLGGMTQLKKLYLGGTQARRRHLAKYQRIDATRRVDARRYPSHGRRAGPPQRIDATPNAVAQWHQGQRRRAGTPQPLTGLRCSSLNGTQVTDAGLEHLTALIQLKDLRLQGTKVTDGGLSISGA